jgi:hypothetical protein
LGEVSALSFCLKLILLQNRAPLRRVNLSIERPFERKPEQTAGAGAQNNLLPAAAFCLLLLTIDCRLKQADNSRVKNPHEVSR